MGQKVNPLAFRMGITSGWRSRWYANKKNFGDWLVQDAKIREFIRKEFKLAGIARVEIERIGEKVRISLFSARPGLIIGKRGAKIDKMSEDVSGLVGRAVEVDVKELESPEINAQIVCEAIAEQLGRRSPYRRTMRRHMEMVMDLGALGVKLVCKGRLGGSEIARCERQVMGRVPLNTLRADIDYGTATAMLKKGTIGVKCWVYRGDKFEEKRGGKAAPAAKA